MEYPLKLHIVKNEVFGKRITLDDDSIGGFTTLTLPNLSIGYPTMRLF